jgi:hypothetical protein
VPPPIAGPRCQPRARHDPAVARHGRPADGRGGRVQHRTGVAAGEQDQDHGVRHREDRRRRPCAGPRRQRVHLLPPGQGRGVRLRGSDQVRARAWQRRGRPGKDQGLDLPGVHHPGCAQDRQGGQVRAPRHPDPRDPAAASVAVSVLIIRYRPAGYRRPQRQPERRGARRRCAAERRRPPRPWRQRPPRPSASGPAP